MLGDGMVLQRAGGPRPARSRAAVFGQGGTGLVSVAVHADGSPPHAAVTAEGESGPGGEWKVLLPPHPAGGSFTVVATDAGGGTASLANVTFGDVWFCSGQSNLELSMHFTFDRNDSYAAAGRGEFDDVRIFHMGHSSQPFRRMQWVANGSAVLTNWTVASAAVANGGSGDQCEGGVCSPLDQFSAACWYFAEKLSLRLKASGERVPLGMVESAWGGTTIEQWLSVDDQLLCSNISCHSNASLPYSAKTARVCSEDSQGGNGGLFGGMVAPFVNMTITGWTWWQGENNLFADAGTVLPQPGAPDGTGYACLLKRMISSWRRVWSAAPDTTPAEAPFGIVQLADGTDEGWGCNMRQMHSAETANHGVVPNPDLPGTFVAAAHDLGEPWDDACKGAPHWCCTCANTTRDPACGAGVDSKFDPVTKFPWLIQQRQWPCLTGAQTTPQLMGGVHPSTKSLVGARLAQAAFSLHYGHSDRVAWIGPVVESCGIEAGGGTLRVNFNRSLLVGGDTVEVRAYDRAERASATFVRLGTPLPADAWKNELYKNRAPWWGDDGTWFPVDISASADGYGFVADLSHLNNHTVTAIKYGQGIPGRVPQSGHGRVCCGSREISLNPCPPDSCPIRSAKQRLPAMPFMAAIDTGGSCSGIRPQIIAGLD